MQYFFKKFLLIYYCKKRDVKKTMLRAILKTIFNFITYRQEFFLEVKFFSKIFYFMSLHNINSSSGFQEDFQDSIALVLLEKFGDIGCWSLPALAGSIAYLKGYSNIPVGITLLGLFQKCIVDALKAFAPRERPRPFLYGKVSKQDPRVFSLFSCCWSLFIGGSELWTSWIPRINSCTGSSFFTCCTQ